MENRTLTEEYVGSVCRTRTSWMDLCSVSIHTNYRKYSTDLPNFQSLQENPTYTPADVLYVGTEFRRSSLSRIDKDFSLNSERKNKNQ